MHAARNFQRRSLQSTMFCWILGLGGDGLLPMGLVANFWKHYLKISGLRTELSTAELIVIAKATTFIFLKLPFLPPLHFRMKYRFLANCVNLHASHVINTSSLCLCQ